MRWLIGKEHVSLVPCLAWSWMAGPGPVSDPLSRYTCRGEFCSSLPLYVTSTHENRNPKLSLKYLMPKHDSPIKRIVYTPKRISRLYMGKWYSQDRILFTNYPEFNYADWIFFSKYFSEWSCITEWHMGSPNCLWWFPDWFKFKYTWISNALRSAVAMVSGRIG